MNFVDFQDSLQNLKKDKRIKQADIARGLNTSTSNLSQKYNNPKSEVTISDMEKVQDYLGIKLYIRTDNKNIQITENSQDRQNDTSITEKVEGFGKRLTKLQDKHEYLDKDMAKLLRISEEEYIDLKLGDTEPDFNNLVRLKQCFKVSIDWLLFGE